MIELRDDLIFAQGGRRICFIHPDDPSRCIKVLSCAGDPTQRRKKSVWYKRLRPLSSFNDNLRELESFQALEKQGDGVWNHFPRCYGIQPTSRGDGIVTDLIRDEKGSVSKTVRQYVATHGKTAELRRALGVFFGLLLVQRVVTRDILDHNLVVQAGEEGLRIVMIDGFGSSEAIPVTCWFSGVARLKVFRKISRCRERYGFDF